MPSNNMYSLNVKTWSPFVGCKFDCIYCKSSFQAQAKRQKQRCMKCYNFEPHEHPERLDQPLPKTGYMQFIFTCSMGDISFCSTEYLERIVDRIRREPDKTFLIQSKDPQTFSRMVHKQYKFPHLLKWPNNVILGTTIESNIDGGRFAELSKAPMRCSRWRDLKNIEHPYKMVTVEPILNFTESFGEWIQKLNPCMVWIGYDSKKNKLPEPPIEKVRELHWQLSKMGIVVMLKKIRV